MPHKITADHFLEALDLPSEHPYVQPQDNIFEDEKQEWSISSYVNSWKDSLTSSNSIRPNIECSFPSLSWTMRRQYSHDDSIEDDVCRGIGSSIATATHQSLVSYSNELDFFEEIKPCMVSMFHMNIILWAPLVLIVCIKRLYVPRRTPLHYHLDQDCSPKSSSGQKRSAIQKAGYFNAIPSFPSRMSMPSLRHATMTRGKQERQAPQPYQNNTSFERLLLSLSLFLSAISSMASFSAIFSIEEKKEDAEKPNTNKESKTHEDTKDSLFEGYRRVRSSSISDDSTSQGPFVFTSEWMAYLVALIFTAVIMNDAMYVLAFPQTNLVALHVFVIYISLKRFGSRVALVTALPISAMAFYIMAHQDLDLPTIESGLYYDETNPFISEVIRGWPVDKRTYENGTPWMLTGDTRTGLPFMVNKVPQQKFIRRWVPLPEENEAILLDIAFPDSMIINAGKRVYLLLHGINGDSNEGYVVDFAHRQVSQGNVVAVMVSRGLGDSTIIGNNLLHFARVSDVKAAARALKKAITTVSPDEGLLLAGVGYSMGAITLSNYVASDPDCDLDVAIAFSGALDTTQQMHFRRSASLWQPFITKAMRDTLFSRYSTQIRNKLDLKQVKEVMKAKNLVDFDRSLFVPYNNFESLDEYYYRMGAMSDFDVNSYKGRIGNVSIPLLCIQSLDDPISYWKTFHDPTRVSTSGGGNTVLLFTETGGHVGWPLGWNPSLNGWRWMSDAASSFAESIDRVRRNPLDTDVIYRA